MLLRVALSFDHWSLGGCAIQIMWLVLLVAMVILVIGGSTVGAVALAVAGPGLFLLYRVLIRRMVDGWGKTSDTRGRADE